MEFTGKIIAILQPRGGVSKSGNEWKAQEYVIEDVRCHLSTPDLTIKESAEQCGFSTLTHFGRFVREHFGCSPREYRKKLRKQ